LRADVCGNPKSPPEPVNESVIYTLPSVTPNPLRLNGFLIHIGITLNPVEEDSSGIDFSG
jgi:hypothetical protein